MLLRRIYLSISVYILTWLCFHMNKIKVRNEEKVLIIVIAFQGSTFLDQNFGFHVGKLRFISSIQFLTRKKTNFFIIVLLYYLKILFKSKTMIANENLCNPCYLQSGIDSLCPQQNRRFVFPITRLFPILTVFILDIFFLQKPWTEKRRFLIFISFSPLFLCSSFYRYHHLVSLPILSSLSWNEVRYREIPFSCLGHLQTIYFLVSFFPSFILFFQLSLPLSFSMTLF